MVKTAKPPVKEKSEFKSVSGYKLDTTITGPGGKGVKPKGKVLFLHGAGESDKHRCLPLAKELSAHGWECLVFSFPGHGHSSGQLAGSTLKERKAVARALAERLNFLPADIIISVSMGGHTAVSLVGDDLKFCKKLVLMVPAAYAAAAEDVPFGPEFSKVLRTPASWRSSSAWEILQNYTGHLVTVQAGQDQVIPPEIYTLIHKHAKQATRHKLFIKDSAHKISFWLNEDVMRLKAFAKAIDGWDFSGLAEYE